MSEAPTELEDRLSRVLADQAKRIDVSIPSKPELKPDPAGRRSRHVSRPSGAAVSAAAAIAVAACVAVLAVVLLGHNHVAPISQAQTSHHRDHNRSTPTPGAVPSTIPAAIRPFAKILAVLRRPQAPADRADPGLKNLLHNPFVIQGIPDLSEMRLATTTPVGTKVFLIPFGPARHFALPEGISPTSPIASVMRQRAHQAKIFLDARGGGPSTLAAIKAGRAWTTSGPHPNQAIILVPDGVAKVSIAVPVRAGSHTRRRIFAQVHNNIAAFVPAVSLEGLPGMIWYGASGNVIKRSSRTD